LNVVILAGEQALNDSGSKSNKAFIKINGRMMIDYVIDAVVKTDNISKITVVGNCENLPDHIRQKVDTILESSGSIINNLVMGVNSFNSDDYVLVCTSDIPMVTDTALNDFIKRSLTSGADFCYPVVDKISNDRKFPGIQRTYIKVKDGTFTGGNVFFIKPVIVERNRALADELVNLRKKPFKMARLFGILFLIKLALGVISIKEAELKFSKIIGAKARAIVTDYAEIGNDVDKASDFSYAEDYLMKLNS